MGGGGNKKVQKSVIHFDCATLLELDKLLKIPRKSFPKSSKAWGWNSDYRWWGFIPHTPHPSPTTRLFHPAWHKPPYIGLTNNNKSGNLHLTLLGFSFSEWIFNTWLLYCDDITEQIMMAINGDMLSNWSLANQLSSCLLLDLLKLGTSCIQTTITPSG